MSTIMESTGKKRPRPRRAFTPEFRDEIVELCQRGDRTVGQIAKDFDLTETAVRQWVTQAELDAGTRSDGLTSDERTELARLRSENRRLQQDVDILKRRRLSSHGRPAERVPVHRRGAGRQAQRQTCLRTARGLPIRLRPTHPRGADAELGRTVQIAWASSVNAASTRSVDVPAVARRMPGESGGVGQQRGEPVHPPVDGHVVDLDAAFGEQSSTSR